MEKLSMKKFEKAELNRFLLENLIGGEVVKTTWTQPGTSCSGSDRHNTVSGATLYDDNAWSNDGIVQGVRNC